MFRIHLGKSFCISSTRWMMNESCLLWSKIVNSNLMKGRIWWLHVFLSRKSLKMFLDFYYGNFQTYTKVGRIVCRAPTCPSISTVCQADFFGAALWYKYSAFSLIKLLGCAELAANEAPPSFHPAEACLLPCFMTADLTQSLQNQWLWGPQFCIYTRQNLIHDFFGLHML